MAFHPRCVKHGFAAHGFAALLTLLAGCAAVGPDHVAPAPEAPARWSDWHGGDATLAAPGSPDAQALARADWSVFADPTLARLQARAADANQDVRIAALRFAQARVQQTMAAAQHGPQLSARAGVTEQRQSEYGAGTRMIDAIAPQNRDQLVKVLSDPFTLYQAGFDASWEPDLWGRVRRSVEAAQASADAGQAGVRQMQWSIAAEVARSYFQSRAVQEQIRLARTDIALARDTLSLLRAKVGGGLLDDSALVRQRQQLEALEARLPQLLAQEAQAINQLTLLCGTRPGALNDELAAAASKTESTNADARWPDLALGVPSELAQRRPDIAAAEARLHAATAQIGVATADLYPRIALGASFGFESVGAQRFGDWGSRQWSIGPSLSLPIFDQGRRRSTVELRGLEQQEAAVAYQQTVLKAWHEIDAAVSAYMAERQRQQRLAKQVADSVDDLALADAKYQNGVTDALPELDAQRSLLQARRDAADSVGQLQIALVAVYKALGDGK